MIRTQYYAQNEFKVPAFIGPAGLKVLGNWVTSDIQLSPLAVLEAIDLVKIAQGDAGAAPEHLDGNAFSATVSPQGVEIENHFLEHVQGEFKLDQALQVLIDFWDYCCQANPEEAESYRREYADEHGRDPLAGVRGFQS
ncbi:hypothetical protein ACWD4B_30050 [Streptomyces sp. NPDC002536]